MAKITLTFDINNIFDPTLTKYHNKKDDISIIQNVEWVINCAMGSIEHNQTSKNSPKYIEMVKLYENLTRQLKSQISNNNGILSQSNTTRYTHNELRELALLNPNDSELGKTIRSKVI